MKEKKIKNLSNQYENIKKDSIWIKNDQLKTPIRQEMMIKSKKKLNFQEKSNNFIPSCTPTETSFKSPIFSYFDGSQKYLSEHYNEDGFLNLCEIHDLTNNKNIVKKKFPNSENVLSYNKRNSSNIEPKDDNDNETPNYNEGNFFNEKKISQDNTKDEAMDKLNNTDKKHELNFFEGLNPINLNQFENNNNNNLNNAINYNNNIKQNNYMINTNNNINSNINNNQINCNEMNNLINDYNIMNSTEKFKQEINNTNQKLFTFNNQNEITPHNINFQSNQLNLLPFQNNIQNLFPFQNNNSQQSFQNLGVLFSLNNQMQNLSLGPTNSYNLNNCEIKDVKYEIKDLNPDDYLFVKFGRKGWQGGNMKLLVQMVK